jgi:filamentous hemagglutinin
LSPKTHVGAKYRQRQNALTSKPATDDDVAKRAYNNASSFYGTGGPVQMGIQAATAALSNMANGGDLAGTLAGASAPALANIIGHHAGINDNDTAKAIAHALLGGAVASLQGNSAAAGASGALSGELAAHAIIDALYPGKDARDLSESDKQLVSNLVTIAAGLAGNMAGGDSRSTIAGAQAGKNAVENNALSDIAQAQSEGKTLEQKAEEHVKAENERYKQENCAGMSADACSAKMYDERRQALKDSVSLGVDFVPVVGDIKGFAEAQSALDYLVAAIGVIPGAGDAAGKAIKAAETALKKGDVAEASKLINKASDEVYATLPMGSKSNQMNQPSNPSYQPVRNQPGTISNREYSGHALDRMQDRGITPSVVENTIKNGKSTPSRGGTTVHFDPESKVSVVTNESGRVVTVKYADK